MKALTMLDQARRERERLQRAMETIEAVIALLEERGQPQVKPVVKKPKRRRKATEAQRQKMRDAWVRRKAAQTTPADRPSAPKEE